MPISYVIAKFVIAKGHPLYTSLQKMTVGNHMHFSVLGRFCLQKKAEGNEEARKAVVVFGRIDLKEHWQGSAEYFVHLRFSREWSPSGPALISVAGKLGPKLMVTMMSRRFIDKG